MNALGTSQEMAIGSDFTGVAPSATVRPSLGVDLYEACTTGGLIVLPPGAWWRISTLVATLDGTAHNGAGSTGTVTLTINNRPIVIQAALTNENDWIWLGGPLLVPPRTRIALAFAPAAVSTVVQQFMAVHEKVRTIGPGGRLY